MKNKQKQKHLPSLKCSTVWSESGIRLVWSGSVQFQLLMPEEENQPKIIHIIHISLSDPFSYSAT